MRDGEEETVDTTHESGMAFNRGAEKTQRKTSLVHIFLLILLLSESHGLLHCYCKFVLQCVHRFVRGQIDAVEAGDV